MIEQPWTMGKKGGDFPGRPKGLMAATPRPLATLPAAACSSRSPDNTPNLSVHISPAGWAVRTPCCCPGLAEAVLGGELGKSIMIYHLR